MLIVCKTCATSYHIPRDVLGENGCRLRCVGCGEAWTVTIDTIDNDGAPVVEGRRVATGALEDAERRVRYALPAAAAATSPDRRRQDRSTPKSYALRRGGKTFAALLILGCAMGALAARETIVRAVPTTSRIFAAVGLRVNLRGLALDNVRTNIFDSGDRKVLIVEGAIVNLRDSSRETPNMRIALRGLNKQELYVWTAPAPKARLGPNEEVAFRTRLAAPPEGVSDVLVRFAAVGDKLSPVKEGL
jgi:predicted Zn finger-like uncharacterized protein